MERAHSQVRAGLSTDQLWGLIAWIVPAIAVLVSKMPTGDLAYQVRAGALMLERGQILQTDPFTFTVFGRDWLDQQWGAQVLLDLLHAPAGWPGLVIVRAALVGAAFGVTFRWTRRANGDPMVAGCLTLGALVVAMFLPGTIALRPQLLAVPLFLLTIWLVRGRASHPRRLLWLAVVGLVWANLHGSFVLLPVIVGIAFVADLVGRASTRWWTGATTLVCLVVPLINPWGIDIYGYVIRLSSTPIVRNVIDEWRPLWRQGWAGLVFLVAVAAIVALVVMRRRRWPTLEEMLGLAVFTVLALASGRNLLWWSLFVPPVVGGLVLGRAHRDTDRSPMAVVVAAALVVLLVIGVVRVLTIDPPESVLAEVPPGITAALEQVTGPDDRVFDGWWGSWLEFAAPQIPMFVDARAEIFPQEVWDDYFTISDARPGWEAVLDRWGIDVILASVDHQGALLRGLAADPDWKRVYRDPDGAIFVRS